MWKRRSRRRRWRVPLSSPAGALGFVQEGGSVQLSSVNVTPTSSPNGDPQFFQFALAAAGIPASGTDAGAIYTGAGVTFNATVQLERSFDGGLTWIVCNVGGTGTLAQYTGATVTPVSLTFRSRRRRRLSLELHRLYLRHAQLSHFDIMTSFSVLLLLSSLDYVLLMVRVKSPGMILRMPTLPDCAVSARKSIANSEALRRKRIRTIECNEKSE